MLPEEVLKLLKNILSQVGGVSVSSPSPTAPIGLYFHREMCRREAGDMISLDDPLDSCARLDFRDHRNTPYLRQDVLEQLQHLLRQAVEEGGGPRHHRDGKHVLQELQLWS